MATAAEAAEDPRSPALANVVVVAGFVVLFTTFATGSPWSWIIGGVMLLAGALWAGAAGPPAIEGLTSTVADVQDGHDGHRDGTGTGGLNGGRAR